MTDCRSPQRNSQIHCVRDCKLCWSRPKGPLTAATMSCFLYTYRHTHETKSVNTRQRSQSSPNGSDALYSPFFSVFTHSQIYLKFHSNLFSTYTHTAEAHHKNVSQNAHRPPPTVYLHERNTEKCHATIPQLSSKWDLTAGWEQQA